MTNLKMPDKRAVLAAVVAEVERALAVMTQAASTAHAAATHPEMKADNDKDTKSIEAGYLAGAQSQRAAELERTLGALRSLKLRAFASSDAIDVTALVALTDVDTDATSHVFLAPTGGGIKVNVGVEVQVVTAQAPLGDALLGKSVGDVVELKAGKKRELEIVGLA